MLFVVLNSAEVYIHVIHASYLIHACLLLLANRLPSE